MKKESLQEKTNEYPQNSPYYNLLGVCEYHKRQYYISGDACVNKISIYQRNLVVLLPLIQIQSLSTPTMPTLLICNL